GSRSNGAASPSCGPAFPAAICARPTSGPSSATARPGSKRESPRTRGSPTCAAIRISRSSSTARSATPAPRSSRRARPRCAPGGARSTAGATRGFSCSWRRTARPQCSCASATRRLELGRVVVLAALLDPELLRVHAVELAQVRVAALHVDDHDRGAEEDVAALVLGLVGRLAPAARARQELEPLARAVVGDRQTRRHRLLVVPDLLAAVRMSFLFGHVVELEGHALLPRLAHHRHRA